MAATVGSFIPQFAGLDPVFQDNSLVKAFFDSLYPELLWRAEAEPILWEAGVGDNKTWTRASHMSVDTTPLVPGQEPQPRNELYEQWKTVAKQYGTPTDINMISNWAALADLFARKLQSLGENAGKTMNRLPRDKLALAYATGHTVADTGGAPTTAPTVASIAGFIDQITTAGDLLPVSSTNPKGFYINGTLASVNVIAATPEDGTVPFGRGTLTLSGAGATIAPGATIVAADAPTIVRSGGGTSVDAVAVNDILTMADVRVAVATLKTNNVPRHSDGYYHCHLPPFAVSHLFSDNEFQRLNEGRGTASGPYADNMVGTALGCRFYENNENPDNLNAGPLQQSRSTNYTSAYLARDIGAEVLNATGVKILRTFITGRGSLYECYVDEGKFISAAGTSGKVGMFTGVTNNSMQVMLDRIRLILRAPQGRQQQDVSMMWSWSGDFGVPSDYRLGSAARFKRTVVIESGIAA